MTLTLQRSNTLLDQSITAGGERRKQNVRNTDKKIRDPSLFHSGWQQAGIHTTASAEVGLHTQTGVERVG